MNDLLLCTALAVLLLEAGITGLLSAPATVDQRARRRSAALVTAGYATAIAWGLIAAELSAEDLQNSSLYAVSLAGAICAEAVVVGAQPALAAHLGSEDRDRPFAIGAILYLGVAVAADKLGIRPLARDVAIILSAVIAAGRVVTSSPRRYSGVPISLTVAPLAALATFFRECGFVKSSTTSIVHLFFLAVAGFVVLRIADAPAADTERSSFRPTATAATVRDALSALSRREREVAELLSLGYTNREVADRLCICERTVKNHLYHIYQKTGVANRVELAGRVIAAQAERRTTALRNLPDDPRTRRTSGRAKLNPDATRSQ